MNKDIIIIGGGVAGLTAGYWCAELGLGALVLEKDSEPGGQLLWTFNPINNYPGATAKDGKELRDLMIKQIENTPLEIKPEIKTGAEVRAADLQNKSVELTDGSVLEADALIIATGIRRRRLNVPGEAEFAGKGILTSGVRDRERTSGLDVCIVGGGDAAFENALLLAEAARSVTLVHRGEHFRARGEFVGKAQNDPKIRILTDTVAAAIEGHESVEAVKLLDKIADRTFMLPAQAVLIRIGVEPNTELFQGQIELDEKGFISVNARCETSAENIYAVGDVASPHSMTVSTSAGMGATAAQVINASRSKF